MKRTPTTSKAARIVLEHLNAQLEKRAGEIDARIQRIMSGLATESDRDQVEMDLMFAMVNIH
jgi:hypothetical protein